MAKEFNIQGGYFSPPGYLKVETGGSHDENPNGGVQIGVDPNGVPNMLEEGEPVYDDYVYSDNITAEKAILEQFHIPEKYAGKLYSEIADIFVDEAEDRPLDAISNNGLRVMLGRLADAQEQQKQNQEQKELEDELANMSPEELAELEAMLAEQGIAQQQAQGQEIAEQNAMSVEQGIPVEQQLPVMAAGGPLRRRIRGYMRDTLYDLQHGKSMTKSERDKLKAEELQSEINSLFRMPTLREIKGFLRGEPLGQKKYGLDTLIAFPGIKDPNIKLEKGPAYIGVNDGSKLELYTNGGALHSFYYGGEKDGTGGSVSRRGGAGFSGGSNDLDWTPRFGPFDRYGVEAGFNGGGARGWNIPYSDQYMNEHAAGDGSLSDEQRYDVIVGASGVLGQRQFIKPYPVTWRSITGQLSPEEYAHRKSANLRAKLLFDTIDREQFASGGNLIRRFDEGTPGKVTNSGGAGHSGGGTGGGARETEIRIPSILEMALGSDNKIVQANNRFQDWLHDSTMGRIIDAVVPDSAMGAFVPAIKPAAGVSKVMDEAYRALEAEKAYEGAYRGAEVAGEAASAAKNSGIGKKIWNVAKYFVDPSAVWRSGWKPQGFWGKAAKGIVGGLHSGAVGIAEGDAVINAIGKGIDISKSSKTEEFEIDPFSGRKYARGGNLFWPGGGINTTNFFGNYFPAVRFNTTGIGSMGYPGALPVSSGAALGSPYSGFDMMQRYLKPNGGLHLYNGSASGASQPAARGRASTKKEVATSGQQRPKVEAIAAGDPNIGGMNRVVYTGPKPTISTKPYQMGVNVADTDSSFPTWTRYAGALGHGLLALGNAVTPQTRFTSRQARPYYPTGRINLIDPTYNPIDFGLMENALLASGAGTVNALRNSGSGPSTAASIIAADRNLGQNLGMGFLQNWNANNQQRNEVIAARNSNAAQRANFNYQVEAARAQALDNAQRFNIQNDLYLQRLNDNAESQKYAAISGELGYGLDALTKMGDENMAFNMVNSTSDYGYDDKSGRVRYKRRASNGGTLLKKYKK